MADGRFSTMVNSTPRWLSPLLGFVALALALAHTSCGQQGSDEAAAAAYDVGSGAIANNEISFENITPEEPTQAEREAYLSYYPDSDPADLMAEYFIEMFLHDGDDGAITATKRMTADPVVWRDPQLQDSAIGSYASDVILQGVTEMTGGRLSASLVAGSQPPLGTTTAPAIQIRLDPYQSASACSTENWPVLPGKGLAGGIIWCGADFLATTDPDYLTTLLKHELGHILALTIHSGMTQTIMSYNGIGATLPSFELEAWQLLYQLPDETTWETIMARPEFAPRHANPPPTIAYSTLVDPDPWYTADGRRRPRGDRIEDPENKGAPGNKIKILGNRHFFAWGCHSRNISYPTVTIAGLEAAIEPLNLPEKVYSAENPYDYFNPCPALLVTIPEGATSGPLIITLANGLQSNAVPFTVLAPSDLPAD